MSADFSSGDLARATGHTVRTIRHYEDEGLLVPSEVSDGGHRRYTEEDLERLRLIVDLKEIGLSLCEIRAILEVRIGCSTAAEFAARFRQVIEVHLEEAQRRLQRLNRMRREILVSLELVEQRLGADAASCCPCAVASSERAPRIMKVLARQVACSCAEVARGARGAEESTTAPPSGSGRAASETPPGQAFEPTRPAARG
jgi:DNA-binding transcriptional MerR regulator